jgi:hypothetical protein
VSDEDGISPFALNTDDDGGDSSFFERLVVVDVTVDLGNMGVLELRSINGSMIWLFLDIPALSWLLLLSL